MKPETVPTHLNSEQLPVNGGAIPEKAPVESSPEVGIEKSAERYEQRSEASATMADVSFTTILPLPVTGVTNNTDDTVLTGNPLIAGDDDLIEKEWVDKAKKIVAETKDNPYKRDQDVNKLQVDYIKKRFGRELGVAE